MKYIVNDDVVLSRPLDGPLSTQIPAFAKWARDQGYAWASRYRQVLLAAGFSRWLGRQAHHHPPYIRRAFGSISAFARSARPDPPRRYRRAAPLRGLFAPRRRHPLEEGPSRPQSP